MAQNETDYTLQLLTTHDEKLMREYLGKHQFTEPVAGVASEKVWLSPPDMTEASRELLLDAYDSGWIAPDGASDPARTVARGTHDTGLPPP